MPITKNEYSAKCSVELDRERIVATSGVNLCFAFSIGGFSFGAQAQSTTADDETAKS